ncbi:MAG: YciI family protein [Anaerolineaceae bacterium]
MKHFMIEVTYRITIEEIGDRLDLHRAYLQTGYDRGLLLMSGPKNPRIGGLVIARAESLEEITAFFAQDPYVLLGLADYRFVEFNPVKYADILSDWIG